MLKLQVNTTMAAIVANAVTITVLMTKNMMTPEKGTLLKLNPPKQVKTTMTTMIAIDDINVDDNEYDDVRKENLVEVEPGKAGADNAAKVGAALLLAETILGTEEECLRVSFAVCCLSHLQGSSVSGIHRPTTRV